jgi:protocatechuate 3,4-dioxygenase alpha subunit
MTPPQTVGPFFSIGLGADDARYVIGRGAPGGFWIRGRVLDGDGEAVPDALVETFQADPAGRFTLPEFAALFSKPNGFRGFGRSATDAEGKFEVYTVKPGPVPDASGVAQSPHITVAVHARGLIEHLVTRIYFEDEDNGADPVLSTLDSERRNTLIASKEDGGYRFDIRLQGRHETIFFVL